MKTTTDFKKMKEAGEKIAMVTAYDYPTAKLAEEASVDVILVGDSLGMVVLGYDSTVPVTINDMIHHTKAVKRGATNTFIVTDMPFMTYHLNREETLRAAAKLIQEAGAHAVKVEGGGHVIEMISALTEAGVPVMAHLGLTPQTVGVLGGYKVQGKTADTATHLIEEAIKCEQAGAFGIVLECIPRQLAKKVTEQVNIPVIGIGAGVSPDGQVLVFHDLVSFDGSRVPKFVKKFSHVHEEIDAGLKQYVKEVKSGHFPTEEHTFTMNKEDLASLSGGE